MQDRVNTDERDTVVVRPFKSNVLAVAEARLREKETKMAPGLGKPIESWDDVDPWQLMRAAFHKIETSMYSGLTRDRVMINLADAENYIDMAFDAFEQHPEIKRVMKP